jgi:hypothetical protein
MGRGPGAGGHDRLFGRGDDLAQDRAGRQAGSGAAFFGYIYGPQARVDVPANAPPMFDAIALDDPFFPNIGFPVAQAWLAAKRPVEIHGYQRGSHGFGLGVPGTTTTLVMDEFVAWVAMQGFLKHP